MKCGYCGEAFVPPARVCPHCGQDPGAGVYQTSAILIATRKGRSMYSSVAEVPRKLRTRLLKYTNGANAGTIIIADRRGREEIAKAMHKPDSSSGLASYPLRLPRALMLAVLAVLVLLAVATAFWRW